MVEHRVVFRRWLGPTLVEWLVIALVLGAGCWVNRWPVWALVVVVLGTRQHALGILAHDGAHQLASPNRKVNDLASQLLCFWPLMIGISAYRKFHFAHHRNVGTDLDPELLHKNHWSKEQWTLPKTRLRILGYFLGDLMGLGIPEVIKAIKLTGTVGLWDRLGPMLWWGLVGTALVLSGCWIVIPVWFVALFTSFWAFFRLRIWTEHVGTAYVHRVTANWWQRLCITPHNTWYHYEHHENPAVPFWRMPELRSRADATLSIASLFRSYGAPGKLLQPTGQRLGS